MGAVGCYSLDLYCDLPGHEDELQEWYRSEYTGHTLRDCLRQARKNGWRRLRGEMTDTTMGTGRWACPRHPRNGPFQPHPLDTWRTR